MPRDDDRSSVGQNLTIAFPFFDALFSQLWVNINGAMSFLSPISKYTPACAPVQRAFSMISPFWADVDTRDPGYNDGIYFRESLDDTDLQQAQTEIINAFPNLNGIQLKWVFIVTWYNVTFYDTQNHPGQKRNTFQAAITTDGIHSFAIFYYNNITWTTGDASHGVNGFGGTPAQAGFDAGDITHRLMIDGSCTSEMLTIQDRSNVNFPGKWIFRVDSSDIQTAGCTTNFTSTDILRISPTFVTTFGQVNVEVSGPCIIAENSTVTCRIYDPTQMPYVESEGKIIGTFNSAKVVCPIPFLFTTGRLQLEIDVSHNVNSSETTNSVYNGFIYVTEMSPDGNGLNLKVNKALNGSVDNTIFTWDPERFVNGTEFVDIQIIVFDLSTITKPVVKSIIKIGKKVENIGKWIWNYAEEEAEKPSLPFCHFDPTEIYLQIAFEAIEFGWDEYSHPDYRSHWLANAGIEASQFIGDFCDDWVREAECEAWYYSSGTTITIDSQPCPPTLEQAQVDLRFAPEFSRDVAFYHSGEDICYQSVAPSPNGGGQECCYKNEEIDCSINGGHSEERHPNYPFSHFIDDTLPWIMCCYKQDEEICAKYQAKRPCDRGANYTPPAPARGTGDPHLNTFDGYFYTFNGFGEFWILQNSSFQPLAVQSRMEPLNATANEATIFSGFVFAVPNAAIIQIQKSLIRIVDIYIDGQQLDITSPNSLKRLSMDGWQMIIAEDLSAIHIGFSIGFAFEITTISGAFGFSASASPNWSGKTLGLLGIFNGHQDDDLTSQNGTIIPLNSTLQQIHENFGLTWITTSETTLFKYFNGKTWDDYNHIEYMPSFSFDPNAVSNHTKELCDNDWACIFDYHYTGSAAIANQTISSNQIYNETVTALNKTVETCPQLKSPANGYFNVPNYFEGAKAQFNLATK
uniref:Uncharacterized protein n=1 Tax=Panagrolaimus superbus TaxID=310955 RepID=A0A914XYT1_9BILA